MKEFEMAFVARENQRTLKTDRDFKHGWKYLLVQQVRLERNLEPYESKSKGTDIHIFAVDWYLEFFSKNGHLPTSIRLDQLFSIFGNLREVVRYLIHRRRQLMTLVSTVSFRREDDTTTGGGISVNPRPTKTKTGGRSCDNSQVVQVGRSSPFVNSKKED